MAGVRPPWAGRCRSQGPRRATCASSDTCQVAEPQSFASFSARLKSICMRRLRAPLYPPDSEDSHGWTTSKRLHPHDCCENRTLTVSLKAGETTSSDQNASTGAGGAAPQPTAVAFVTTEHFTLQGARAAAIAESTSGATIFIGSVSAGLVALGLIATATRIGTAFYAFGLILLSTLSFIGLVTFDRVLQSGIEDHGYAE